MKLSTEIYPDYTLINIDTEDSLLTMESDETFTIPSVHLERGVILTGDAPPWFYLWLTSQYKDCQWVAWYIPFAETAMIAYGNETYKISDIVELTEAIIV